ncbi:hypothetical protein BJ165DRAFT_1613259 [Panaeolus papilionaceus]|nr:hypothetical protein BJ165DRAFT_1613259 [Panaeolus papilionaceus]
MCFGHPTQLSSEIFELIISELDAKTDISTLKAVTLSNRQLRTLSQTRIFANVDLAYNVEWKNQEKDAVVSLVDSFIDLLLSSPRIASYVRGISFLWDTGNSTCKLDAKTGLASAHTIIGLAKNLKRIWFPVTNFYSASESFPSWEDLPETLQSSFYEFYQRPSNSTGRHINILGVREFPAHLLLKIPEVTELSIMPLGFKEEGDRLVVAADGSPTHYPYMLKALKLHYYSQEHSFFNWKDTINFLKQSSSGVPHYGLDGLSDLQIVCAVDDADLPGEMGFYASLMNFPKPESYIPVLLDSCRQTLKNLTIRLDDQDSLYTSKRWGKTRATTKPTGKMQIDLSKLSALESLSIHFSVDQSLDEDDDDSNQRVYKTHTPWVAGVLKTLIKSPAFSRTLNSITFTVSLGKWSSEYGNYFPTDEDVSLLDWSDITKILSQKPRPLNLKTIRFTFMPYVAEGKCTLLQRGEVDLVYNEHLRNLQAKTGILVVE